MCGQVRECGQPVVIGIELVPILPADNSNAHNSDFPQTFPLHFCGAENSSAAGIEIGETERRPHTVPEMA